MGLKVNDIYPQPNVGDKVEILDYSFFDANESVRISKMEEIRILEVFPVVIGSDGNYNWEYEVYTTADPDQNIMMEMYKVIK